MSTYNSEFMVFELMDDGTKNEIDINPGELGSILDPNQVFVIVKEELRRIYIWKGSKSPVRKRFISSRVAQQLQNELITEAGFHRCVIKSIDQGDELIEFLNTFQLESMEVTERLPDMRYIRNIEKEGKMQAIIKDTYAIPEKKGDMSHYSPALGSFNESAIKSALESPDIEPQISNKKITEPVFSTPSKLNYLYPSKSTLFKSEQVKEILNTILKTKIPTGLKRQNIIIGNHLFGAVSKSASVLGKDMEQTEWERIKIVPSGVVDLENNKLRVYFDEKHATIKGIELLILDKKSASTAKKRTTRPPAKKRTTRPPAKKRTTRPPAKKRTTRPPAIKRTTKTPAIKKISKLSENEKKEIQDN